MTVTIHYFAMLRETARRACETRFTTATTPGELYAELERVYGFTIPVAKLRVAVNDEFVSLDTKLRAGDAVTFIPPVAGG